MTDCPHCAEERARRLTLEAEYGALRDLLTRTKPLPPKIVYVAMTRLPMPPREAVTRHTGWLRTKPPVKIIEPVYIAVAGAQVVHVPVPTEPDLGPLARFGARIDRFLKLVPGARLELA